MSNLTPKTLCALLLGCAIHAAQAEPVVDINSADAATLADVMVGIGASKAAAIVEYRDENGPFTSVEDLALIKGIGSATIEKNRERLTVKPTP
ncbi:MAG: ComEA family DNA-binding protein [Gammaproteobacteria bacterium]